MEAQALNYLILILHRAIDWTQHNAQQRWVQLALLKTSIRRALATFQAGIQHVVPGSQREGILEEFDKFKDLLWQAVGAVHGELCSVEVNTFYATFTEYRVLLNFVDISGVSRDGVMQKLVRFPSII